MAHFVFQRNNGFGDFDYIRSFETMEITDYPELAIQVDDKYIGYIDMLYLNQLGFYAVGITTLGLRISPLQYFRPLVRNFRPTIVPRPPRAHVPGVSPIVRAPRAPKPAPAPRAPRPAPAPRTARPAPAPRPAARPAPRPAGPGRIGKGPGGRGGRGPGM